MGILRCLKFSKKKNGGDPWEPTPIQPEDDHILLLTFTFNIHLRGFIHQKSPSDIHCAGGTGGTVVVMFVMVQL